MPLNEEQQRTIASSLEHLLAFDSDDHFFQQEDALVNAMLNPVGEDHDYYWLRECYYHPDAQFQGLERQGPAVSVGEIQAYILDLVTEHLQASGQKPYRWNYQLLFQSIPQSNWSTAFKSAGARVDGGENPWQLPLLTDSVYSQRLRLSEEEEVLIDDPIDPLTLTHHHVHVDVDINPLSSGLIKKTAHLTELETNFASDQAERIYIENIRNRAEKRAQDIAVRSVMTYLSTIINVHSYKNRILDSPAACKLLTHSFWLQQVADGKIDLRQIVSLREQEADNLLNPAIIFLIQSGVLTINTAMSLRQEKVRVITHPVYSNLLRTQQITLQEFNGISARRARLLINPAITALIQRGKMTAQQAVTIPYQLKDILTNPAFADYFGHNQTDWEAFSKLPHPQCNILIENEMASLVVSKVLPFDTLAYLLTEYPDTENAKFHCHVTAFAKRLFSICMGSPHWIQTRPDNVQAVIDDMTSFSEHSHFLIDDIREWTSYILSHDLRQEISRRLSELMEGDHRIRVYQEFHNILQGSTQDQPIQWTTVIREMAELSATIQNRLRVQTMTHQQDEQPSPSEHGLFKEGSKKRKAPCKDSDILDFCNQANSLTALADLGVVRPQAQYFF